MNIGEFVLCPVMSLIISCQFHTELFDMSVSQNEISTFNVIPF